MNDIECPYCGHEQEICNDDGHGLEEDIRHEEQCEKCKKFFVFTTYVSFHYTPYKADCLNGGEHKLEPVFHIPKHWPDWVRCKDCEYEKRGEFKEDTE
jgi:hypothetical protein